MMGEDDATDAMREGLAHADAAGDESTVGWIYMNLYATLVSQRRLAEADREYETGWRGSSPRTSMSTARACRVSAAARWPSRAG